MTPIDPPHRDPAKHKHAAQGPFLPGLFLRQVANFIRFSRLETVAAHEDAEECGLAGCGKRGDRYHHIVWAH